MEQSGCNMKCAGSMYSGLYKGLRWLEFPKAKFGSPRNLKNCLFSKYRKNRFAKHCLWLEFCWVRVTLVFRLFPILCWGSMVLVSFYGLPPQPQIPTNPNMFSNILLGSGCGLGCLNFLQLFFHFFSPKKGPGSA